MYNNINDSNNYKNEIDNNDSDKDNIIINIIISNKNNNKKRVINVLHCFAGRTI